MHTTNCCVITTPNYNCNSGYYNKVSSCPHCGAPVYEWVSTNWTLSWYQGWQQCAPVPQVHYSCNCRFNKCIPQIVQPIHVVCCPPPKKGLAKKRKAGW